MSNPNAKNESGVPSDPSTGPLEPPGGSGHPSSMVNQDVFLPVATNAPPKNIKARNDHPVKNLHVRIHWMNMHLRFSNLICRPIRRIQLRPTSSMPVFSLDPRQTLAPHSRILSAGQVAVVL